MTKECRLTVRLTADLADQVQRVARDRRTTIAAVIREALEERDKTQLLAARLAEVLQELQRNGEGPLSPRAQAAEHEDSGVENPSALAGGEPQPMDEATLARTMRSMLDAFGAADEA